MLFVLGGTFLVRSQLRSARLRHVATDRAVHRGILVHPVHRLEGGPSRRSSSPRPATPGWRVSVSGTSRTPCRARLARRVADEPGWPVHVVGHGRSGTRTADGPGRAGSGVTDPGGGPRGHGRGQRRDASDAAAAAGPGFRSAARHAGRPRWAGSALQSAGVPRHGRRAGGAAPGRRGTGGDGAVRAARGPCPAGRRAPTKRRAVGPRFVGDAAATGAATFHPSALRYGLIADVLAPAVVAAVSDVSRPERSRPLATAAAAAEPPYPLRARNTGTQRLLTAHGCERRSRRRRETPWGRAWAR